MTPRDPGPDDGRFDADIPRFRASGRDREGMKRMQTPIRLSRRTRLSLAMLMAGLGSFSLIYCPQPILPALASHFGVNPATSSLAVALTSAPMAIAIVVGSVLSDRIPRRRLMITSLFLAAVLTMLTAFAPNWHVLLFLRILTGLALAGVPAVAMAHISAETDDTTIGSAMGIYVAGTGLGGVLGRLGSSLAVDVLDWRWSFALTGGAGILIAAAFVVMLPPNLALQEFDRSRTGWRLGEFIDLARDRVLALLYLQAFLFMGVFITVFNYAGFQLAHPPFNLSQAAIGSVFILFLIGCVASIVIGWLSGRIDRPRILGTSLCLMVVGLLVTLSLSTPVYILGLIIIVIGFFGAHAIASSWVSSHAAAQAGKAAALYLLFYHLGSALVSLLGGVVWQAGGWSWVVAYSVALCLVAVAGTRSRSERGDDRQSPPV